MVKRMKTGMLKSVPQACSEDLGSLNYQTQRVEHIRQLSENVWFVFETLSGATEVIKLRPKFCNHPLYRLAPPKTCYSSACSENLLHLLDPGFLLRATIIPIPLFSSSHAISTSNAPAIPGLVDVTTE